MRTAKDTWGPSAQWAPPPPPTPPPRHLPTHERVPGVDLQLRGGLPGAAGHGGGGEHAVHALQLLPGRLHLPHQGPGLAPLHEVPQPIADILVLPPQAVVRAVRCPWGRGCVSRSRRPGRDADPPPLGPSTATCHARGWTPCGGASPCPVPWPRDQRPVGPSPDPGRAAPPHPQAQDTAAGTQ